MKVALLCSGLGRVRRGHEVFARDLYSLLRNDIDMTLFKGGGDAVPGEVVVEHVPRDSPDLDGMHLAASPRWIEAAKGVERMRVEGETFAYGSLGRLLAGDFDVIHCLEQEVCGVLYAQRHLFRRTPRFLFSNGGALPAADLPPCDFVQEHSEYNLQRSDRRRAFLIPHGVDTGRFHPGPGARFRAEHGIPADAMVVASVGTICYWHKRMDYVIREVAAVPDAWLVIAGQESPDAPAIRELGQRLMSGRILITSLPHEQLPDLYRAADVFTLGSLFETFGIVYIEAMASGLPVICTDHPNQRGIVKVGRFVDMSREGSLTRELRSTPFPEWKALGARSVETARKYYSLEQLRPTYVERYRAIANAPIRLPQYSWRTSVLANAVSLMTSVRRKLH
ncbi:MAG: glycosyltransferase family 4 protein [Burkholderiales bacterium]